MTADTVVCDVRFEAKETLDEQNTTIERNGLQASYWNTMRMRHYYSLQNLNLFVCVCMCFT
jgi:hypothetical protein